MKKCPCGNCPKPYEEHKGVEQIVHRHNADADMACTCPCIGPGEYCQVHFR